MPPIRESTESRIHLKHCRLTFTGMIHMRRQVVAVPCGNGVLTHGARDFLQKALAQVFLKGGVSALIHIRT